MDKRTPNQFKPNYSVPPGVILKEWLAEQGLTQVELAQRMGRSKKMIQDIVKAAAPVTAETAVQLEKVTGIEASFWNNLEVNHQAFLAAQKETEAMRSSFTWLAGFSYSKMASFGWVPVATEKLARVNHLLRFYAVATFDQWRLTYTELEGSARESIAFKSDLGDLSAWLRKGEIEAAKIECQPYDEKVFRDVLAKLRAMTTATPERQSRVMREWCASAGIALVVVPELPKTHVSGFTRWLTPHKAVLQLSLRHQRDDHLWFTFFHEAAHILLHGKKERFFEFQGQDNPKEAEANQWAANFLIPPTAWRAFSEKQGSKVTSATIRAFASEIGIAPGLVAGRVQRETGNFSFDQELFRNVDALSFSSSHLNLV